MVPQWVSVRGIIIQGYRVRIRPIEGLSLWRTGTAEAHLQIARDGP